MIRTLTLLFASSALAACARCSRAATRAPCSMPPRRSHACAGASDASAASVKRASAIAPSASPSAVFSCTARK